MRRRWASALWLASLSSGGARVQGASISGEEARPLDPAHTSRLLAHAMEPGVHARAYLATEMTQQLHTASGGTELRRGGSTRIAATNVLKAYSASNDAATLTTIGATTTPSERSAADAPSLTHLDPSATTGTAVAPTIQSYAPYKMPTSDVAVTTPVVTVAVLPVEMSSSAAATKVLDDNQNGVGRVHPSDATDVRVELAGAQASVQSNGLKADVIELAGADTSSALTESSMKLSSLGSHALVEVGGAGTAGAVMTAAGAAAELLGEESESPSSTLGSAAKVPSTSTSTQHSLTGDVAQLSAGDSSASSHQGALASGHAESKRRARGSDPPADALSPGAQSATLNPLQPAIQAVDQIASSVEKMHHPQSDENTVVDDGHGGHPQPVGVLLIPFVPNNTLPAVPGAVERVQAKSDMGSGAGKPVVSNEGQNNAATHIGISHPTVSTSVVRDAGRRAHPRQHGAQWREESPQGPGLLHGWKGSHVLLLLSWLLAPIVGLLLFCFSPPRIAQYLFAKDLPLPISRPLLPVKSDLRKV